MTSTNTFPRWKSLATNRTNLFITPLNSPLPSTNVPNSYNTTFLTSRRTAPRHLPSTSSSHRRAIAPYMQMNGPPRPERPGDGGNPQDSPQRDLFVPVFVVIAITGYTLILAWDLAKSWLIN